MIPYILISLFPIILYPPYHKKMRSMDINVRNKAKKNYLVLCGIVLILFMGLRNPRLGSTDTVNYYNNMLRAISASSWSEYYVEDYFEGGFQLFVFLLSRVFKHAQALLFITSAIYVFFICFFIYRNSEDLVMSLVMYITLGLMTFEMQGMRQAIAMSICLLAYELLKSKKKWWFLLTVILAMQFHRTAIIFALVLLVFNLGYSTLKLIIVFLSSIVSLLLTDRIISLGNQFFDRNYTYVKETGGYVATLIYVLIFIFSVLFNRRLKTDKNQSAMFYVLSMGAISYLMRYTGVMIAERISFYFMFSQMAMLPGSLRHIDGRNRAIIKITVHLLMILLFVYRLNGSDFLPYRFFWQ